MNQLSNSTARLGQILSVIEQPMAAVDCWLDAQFQPDHHALAPLIAHVGRFRGKRVRAAQVLLVSESLGGSSATHIPLAGILEMIHAATLVHDDVLDEAEERRGLDCVHIEWGRHTSVLLGDWIYSKAFLRSTELEDQTCSRVLAAAVADVCCGEIHQNLTRGDFELSEADYFHQIDGKTASLYAAAGRLSAYYSGADEELQVACERHGMLTGRAFQIIDDVLDLEGNQDQVGKSLGTDWARGKMTLPLIRLRDGLNDADRKLLGETFGSGQDRETLFDSPFGPDLHSLLVESKQYAMEILQQAADSLQALPPSPARDSLQELTMFLGTRKL